MKKLHVLLMVLLSMSAAVVQAVDLVALKKSIQEDAQTAVQKVLDDAKNMSGEFQIHEVQKDIIMKTYPRDEHESFRKEEEARLTDRINAKAQKLKDELSSQVEKAFVDVMKQQNAFADLCAQDIAAFKQQLSENIQKMAQGKKATPITYAASEGVVKGTEVDTGKKVASAPSTAMMGSGDLALAKGSADVSAGGGFPPFMPLPVPGDDGDMVDKKSSANLGTPANGASANMGTPANAPVAASKSIDKPVKSASPATSKSAPSKTPSPTKAQQDLLKKIRGS